MLRLINNSLDGMWSFEVVLKFFVKGFGEKSLDALKAFASELKISLYQSISVIDKSLLVFIGFFLVWFLSL
jgi:superfamily I DNA/RNA helicase